MSRHSLDIRADLEAQIPSSSSPEYRRAPYGNSASSPLKKRVVFSAENLRTIRTILDEARARRLLSPVKAKPRKSPHSSHRISRGHVREFAQRRGGEGGGGGGGRRVIAVGARPAIHPSTVPRLPFPRPSSSALRPLDPTVPNPTMASSPTASRWPAYCPNSTPSRSQTSAGGGYC